MERSLFAVCGYEVLSLMTPAELILAIFGYTVELNSAANAPIILETSLRYSYLCFQCK